MNMRILKFWYYIIIHIHIYIERNVTYDIWHIVDEIYIYIHNDPTNHDLGYAPSIVPWNENVRSLCLRFFGPQFTVGSIGAFVIPNIIFRYI